jgi:hypothetical protein
MSTIEWTLKGRLTLVPQLPEVRSLANISTAHGMAVPLRGVRVRVSAKQFDADVSGWEVWAAGETDATGAFELRNSKNEWKRLFRVEAMFKDDLLKIYPPNDSLLSALTRFADDYLPTRTRLEHLTRDLREELIMQLLDHTTRLVYDCKWYTMYESEPKDKREPSVVDFGTLPFAGPALFDRNDFTARRHAEIWFVAKQVMGLLDHHGLGFRTDRPAAILHPHDNGMLPDGWEASFANPHTDIVHLARNNRRDEFNVDTIVHELTHLWAYQNVRQEERLATYLLTHFDTHSGRLPNWVAWHEAFAESMSNEFIREIFGTQNTVYGAFPSQRRPYSRPYLRTQNITTRADLDFYEDGWASIFGLLVNPDPCDLDMTPSPGPYAVSGTPGAKDQGWVPCTAPKIGWKNILKAVAGAGNQTDGGLERGAMRMESFFRRIADQVPEFTERYQEAFASILDPQESRTPRDLLTVRGSSGVFDDRPRTPVF